jgi:hypothetical protein
LHLFFNILTQSQCTHIFNISLCLLFDYPCFQNFFIHCTSHAICKLNQGLLISGISPSSFSSLHLPKTQTTHKMTHKWTTQECKMLLCFIDVSWVRSNNKRKQKKQTHLLFIRLRVAKKKCTRCTSSSFSQSYVAIKNKW